MSGAGQVDEFEPEFTSEHYECVRCGAVTRTGDGHILLASGRVLCAKCAEESPQ